MNELIKKYEIRSKVLLDIIQSKESTEEEIGKALIARRFMNGFIYDLKTLKHK